MKVVAFFLDKLAKIISSPAFTEWLIINFKSTHIQMKVLKWTWTHLNNTFNFVTFSVAIATLGTSNVRPSVCPFVCKQVV